MTTGAISPLICSNQVGLTLASGGYSGADNPACYPQIRRRIRAGSSRHRIWPADIERQPGSLIRKKNARVGSLERHDAQSTEKRTAGCLPDRSRAPRCPTGASPSSVTQYRNAIRAVCRPSALAPNRRGRPSLAASECLSISVGHRWAHFCCDAPHSLHR